MIVLDTMRKRTLAFFLIFILGAFGLVQASSAQNAILFFSPESGTFVAGESFWIAIMVDTGQERVSAVAAYFSYPQESLELLGVDTSRSPMTLFAEQDAREGKVEISGGKAGPGFSGVHEVASVGFLVKGPSLKVQFTFDSDSAVLRDSDTQNILHLASSGKAVYTLQAGSAPSLPTPTPQLPESSLEPVGELLILSELKIKKIAEASVLVSWSTNRPADSRVGYGETSEYDFSVFDGEITASHALVLSDLSPRKDYYAQITSKDGSGEIAKSENLRLGNILAVSDGNREEPAKSSLSPTAQKQDEGGVILAGIVAIGALLILGFLFIRKRRKKALTAS